MKPKEPRDAVGELTELLRAAGAVPYLHAPGCAMWTEKRECDKGCGPAAYAAAAADDENPAEVVTLNDLLHLGGAITTRGDELKVWIRDLDNGSTHKAYLGADECERLANGFRDLAVRLRLKG